MPVCWPFGTFIRRDEDLRRLNGGRKRDRSRAKAARASRRRNRA